VHRFFVSPETLLEPVVTLPPDVASQVSRVLRLRPGDEITLLDGEGNAYAAKLVSSSSVVTAELLGRTPCNGEPAHRVALYMSMLNKPDKFDWAVQKATELGVAEIVPVVAARSVTDRAGSVRLERWRRIAREAAEQSGRCRIPSLSAPRAFEAALQFRGSRRAESEERIRLLVPALRAATSVEEALTGLPADGRVALFIGPEGGFSPGEVEAARLQGASIVTLGPRTLRAETAALVALSLVMNALGELGFSGRA
jgi:16S rRNA (uracil1498-N3)-methyltransferase